MSILKVARMGHPVLRQVAEPIEAKDVGSPEIQTLIDDMYETMAEYNGVGLAAPQVHASKQLALVGGDFGRGRRARRARGDQSRDHGALRGAMGMYEGV